MPVVDASVLVEYLTGAEHFDQARARLLAPADRMWAPHLVDAEVGHVVRRRVLAGELTAAHGQLAIQDLADLPMQRAGHVGLLERAWELRKNVTFYDGLYVALAELLGLPLLTLDARLASATGIRAEVEVIG